MKTYFHTLSKPIRLILLIEIIVPIALLSLGIYHGLLQTLYRSGMLSQRSFAALDFYQGLTLHGVINAIVLTTFFAVAFGHLCMAYYLKRKLHAGWAGTSLVFMLVGTLMAAWAMLVGKASVLYTFYPPLKAHPVFYVGVALLVVGSWIAFFGWVVMYRKWRSDHPQTQTPLPVLGTLVNFTIWLVCTLPAAYLLLAMLLPWSAGWVAGINVPLSRTLFWFFGHALVYFWLLPSYIMYYSILPNLAGGKLYSENAGRLVFFLFLIFSIPVGVHHQFSEPSITKGVKFFQAVLTFGVAIPSFLTAFTIAASLEYGAWRRGYRRLFDWIVRLPFFDKERYLFAYLIVGLIIFIAGGLTGIVNASYTLNSMVHNTAWMPGHFHMTVGGPVFLAIIGMSLYMYSALSGRPVKWKKLATIVPYLWMIGLFIFSTGLMLGGLIGEPRRTNLGMTYLNPESPLFRPDWIPTTSMAVIGGLLMFASMIIYALVFFKTIFTASTKEKGIQLPAYEVLHEEKPIPLLNNFRPWLAIMLVLILLAYWPALRDVKTFTGADAPPFGPENPVPELVEPK